MIRRTPTLLAYAAATDLITPFAPAVLRARARRGKEDPARLAERLGRASVPRPDGPLAWLHGASIGESLSLLPLIDALAEARPDLNLLVTSGTLTSAALLAQRLPPSVIHQFAPIDTQAATRAFLGHWRPGLGVFVESELWPNLLLGAKDRGARLALLSAKLSEASARGWARAPGAAKQMFGAFDLILARDEASAQSLRGLGAVVAGLGDLKFGAAPLPADPDALARARAEIGGRPLILAASTHAGEDEIILDAFREAVGPSSDALLVITPRHPERGLAVAALAWARGERVAVRSAGETPALARVYVADTLGELGLWFRLARLAILGGSFIPGVGGHNPLEPARLSCPFVSGPNVANWLGVYQDLWRLEGDAPLTSPAELMGRIAGALLAEAPRGASEARAYVEARDDQARSIAGQVLELAP